MIRVGLVAYGLERPAAGIGRVAQELGIALARTPGCEVTFLTTYEKGPFRGPEWSSEYLPGCRLLPGLMLFGGPLIALAARRLKLDIVHDPCGVSPFTVGRWAGNFQRVVHIHDAIAFRYPEGYPWLNNFLLRSYVPATLPNVDQVLTVSKHARSELAAFMGPPADHAKVVYNGVSRHWRPVPGEEADAVAARYGLTEPYLLTVSAQQPRKNLWRLLEAFAELHRRAPAYHLAVAGLSLWGIEHPEARLEMLGIADVVHLLGYVPDADMPALYSAATLFVFPSLYEGFGLPVLEAMACGTPVVCSDLEVLKEIAGEAAVTFDPYDASNIARVLAQVLGDAALRKQLSEQGTARAGEFTWERAAAHTLNVYQQLMETK